MIDRANSAPVGAAFRWLHLVLALSWWFTAGMVAYLAVHPTFSDTAVIILGLALALTGVGLVVDRARRGVLIVAVLIGSVVGIGGTGVFVTLLQFGDLRSAGLAGTIIGWLPFAILGCLISGLVAVALGVIELRRPATVQTPESMRRGGRRRWVVAIVIGVTLAAIPLVIRATIPPDAPSQRPVASKIDQAREALVTGDITGRFPHYRYLDVRCSPDTVALLFEYRIYPYLSGIGVVVSEHPPTGDWNTTATFWMENWYQHPQLVATDPPFGLCEQA